MTKRQILTCLRNLLSRDVCHAVERKYLAANASLLQTNCVKNYHQTTPLMFYNRFKSRKEVKKKSKEEEEQDREIDAKLVEEKVKELDVVTKIPYKINVASFESKTDRFVNRIFKQVEQSGEKTQETFNTAVKIYKLNAGLYMRGHIEFGEVALSKLEEYELQYNLEVYKMIFSIFPEGKYLPTSKIAAEFTPFPRQQDAALQILTKMFDNGVIPDEEFGRMIISRFSQRSKVFTRYLRMLYWMPKFKYMNPWPIPRPPPKDPIQLAVLALKRMSFDLETKITVVNDSKESEISATRSGKFIASAQSPKQRELLSRHPSSKPIIVEGEHYVYLRKVCQKVFFLKTDPEEEITGEDPDYYKALKEEDVEDMFNFTTPLSGEEQTALVPKKSVHEQEDGTVYAMCITSDSSKESLQDWIQFLQTTNSALEHIPVLFRIKDADSLLKETIRQEEEEEL
ncbi:evolutionarily conserved signaling intermediate in Toll pathway, mitochondrial-like [Saccostrea echinata]|uniref:evolutionarily conserved signaling intermediate in Toll pathway, mitochondrial-like n=1 Tax=Saccostrea echinata TaxID=191078 RepID=UPI002A821E70|nr:evolutionarily conserved signaling intermediate in Toll pathway, mitochondrial-like [Saccostrea echinata]